MKVNRNGAPIFFLHTIDSYFLQNIALPNKLVNSNYFLVDKRTQMHTAGVIKQALLTETSS